MEIIEYLKKKEAISIYLVYNKKKKCENLWICLAVTLKLFMFSYLLLRVLKLKLRQSRFECVQKAIFFFEIKKFDICSKPSFKH